MSLMKVAEVARELSCSVDHLHKLIREGKIPAYKFGPRSTRIDLEEVKKLFAQKGKE